MKSEARSTKSETNRKFEFINSNVSRISNFEFRASRQGGMTLVELLVVLALFAVIMGAVYTFEVNTFSYNRKISSSFQTSVSAQAIMKTLLVEIREAAPGGNGAFPVVYAGSTTLSFFADPDNDGVEEQVTYNLIGTKLYKAVINPTGTPPTYSVANQSTTTLLADVRNGVATPVFQYFDANYSGTSTPLTQPVTTTSVHLIKINLVLPTASTTKTVSTVTYSEQASIRNLKTNL